MSEIVATNLAEVIDNLLDRVQYDLCPDPEIPPASKSKRERLDRRREIAQRNRVITERYFGLDGRGGQSMELVGEPFGLTRESVRQITDKVCKRLFALDGIPRPLFASAMRFVRDQAPASKASITKSLVEQGLWIGNRDLTALLAASTILLESDERNVAGQLVCTSEKDGLGEYLVFREQIEWPKMIVSVAGRLVSHNGAATIEQVASGFEAAEEKRRSALIDKATKAKKAVPVFHGPTTASLEFVRTVIDVQADKIWLDEEGQWFTLRNAKRNRVISRLNKIFSCYRSALLVDVAEAIKRSFQKNRQEEVQLLPFNVLAALIHALPGFSIERGYVVYSGKELPGNILPAERALLDFIASNEVGIRREKELEEGVINTISRRVNKDDPEPTVERVRDLNEDEPEVNEYSFSMALNFSPLILSVLSMENGDPERVRGHYRLVGFLR